MATGQHPLTATPGIKSVEVAAKVLLALEEGRGPLNLSGVARLSGLHPAKVHRYLTSLVRTGLASQDAINGMYDLGPASRDLGLEALRRVDPARIAAAYSVDLRNETGHTAEVAVWSSAGPILIAWDPGAHELPVLVRVGSTLPLLDSAVGSVFLAYLPESMTSEALVQQQQRGATRRISAREAKKMKAETLADGYGHTSNRMVLGLASLAAPVFNADRRLECVLGLDLPARMMTTKEMKRLGRLLRATADQATGQPHFTG